MTFDQLTELYLEHQDLYLKPRSLKNAAASFRQLRKVFGAIPLGKIKDRDLQRFLRKRRDQVKDVSVNRDLRYLKCLLRFAVAQEILPRMPFPIRMLKVPTKRSLRVLTKDDFRTLLSRARDPIYGILLVAINTGFRLSEILYLQWGDIDWSAGKIAVTAKGDWSPKNHQERAVYVPAVVLDYLKERAGEPEHYVFRTRTGRPLNPSNISGHIRKVFKEAGLYEPGVPTTHWIRHSVCSTLLGSGVDIETARSQMGHSSCATTYLYAHTTDARMKRVADVLTF